MKVSQPLISKIEMGTLSVSGELLEKLANALGYAPTLFTMPEPIYGAGASDLFHHRKRQSTSLKLMRKLYATIGVRSLQIGRLLKSVTFRCNIPKYPIEEQEVAGEVDIARMIRAAWGVPQGPIHNLTELLERFGIIVAPFHFETPLVDAVTCASQPGMPPVIFINAGLCRSRYRHTLAHELAHIVMHAIPNPDMERQADRFAAEFLMPEADVRRDLQVLANRRTVAHYMQALGELKLMWRASMQAIHRRATDLNIVSASMGTSVWRRMSQLGYKRAGGGEPLEHDLPAEGPATLRALVSAHLQKLRYTVAQLAETLGLLVQEFRELFLPREAAHLRAV